MRERKRKGGREEINEERKGGTERNGKFWKGKGCDVR
jgi:hypothetical protein